MEKTNIMQFVQQKRISDAKAKKFKEVKIERSDTERIINAKNTAK